MELHPLCTLFPRLEANEFKALSLDIKSNGLREPITVANGMILDGGNRFRACIDAGITPKFEQFSGENLINFVLSKNLHRRHLSAGQQSAIIASMADWEKSSVAGDNQHTRSVISNTPLSTIAKRAQESGSSISTQRKADAVVKADPDLGKKVAIGEISLNEAAKQVAPQFFAKSDYEISDQEKAEADNHIAESNAAFESWLKDPSNQALAQEICKKDMIIQTLKTENNTLLNSKNDLTKRLKSSLAKIDKMHSQIKALESEIESITGVRDRNV